MIPDAGLTISHHHKWDLRKIIHEKVSFYFFKQKIQNTVIFHFPFQFSGKEVVNFTDLQKHETRWKQLCSPSPSCPCSETPPTLLELTCWQPIPSLTAVSKKQEQVTMRHWEKTSHYVVSAQSGVYRMYCISVNLHQHSRGASLHPCCTGMQRTKCDSPQQKRFWMCCVTSVDIWETYQGK